jgi:hypothetical protein
MVAWMMLAVIHNAASPSTIFLFIDMTCGAIPVIRMPGMIIHRLFKSVPSWGLRNHMNKSTQKMVWFQLMTWCSNFNHV